MGMKYYLTEISEGDAKISGKAIYEYEDATKAEAMYHKKIGTAMDSELYSYHMCYVTNSAGGIECVPHVFRRTQTAEVE